MKWYLWVLMLVYAATLTWGITNPIVHEAAYQKGIADSKLYYDTTHEFPTKAWVSRYEFTNFKHREEILETLKPFGK